MSTKKQETAPRQQSQSPGETGVPTGSTTCIVHEDAASVKPGNLLRQIEEGGEKYGVMLRPDAADAVLTQFAPWLRNGLRSGRRTKPRRIQARLSEAVYGALQQALRARGVTVQRWIEDLALALIAQEGEKDGR